MTTVEVVDLSNIHILTLLLSVQRTLVLVLHVVRLYLTFMGLLIRAKFKAGEVNKSVGPLFFFDIYLTRLLLSASEICELILVSFY